ncbi:MAG: hypothetical protein IPM29_32015 [Planctomycetes bacterium]|nr:hypothetical protein [Planctomycetota bacterium]
MLGSLMLGSLMLGSLMLGAAACVGPRSDGSTEAVSGTTFLQFDDVPVPDGMELQTGMNQSFSHVSEPFRFGDFHYAGSVPFGQVVSDMRAKMPLFGWSEVGIHDSDQRAELEFLRRPYHVRCEIAALDSGRVKMLVEYRTDFEK